MIEHEFWRDPRTGEVWAVRLVDGVVAGVCGPLDVEEIDDEFLDSYDYATEPAAQMERERERFSLYETALPYDGS